MEIANKHKYLPIKSHRHTDIDEIKSKCFQHLLKTIGSICNLNGQWSVIKTNEEILNYKQNNGISNSQFDRLIEQLLKIAVQKEAINVEIRIDLLKLIKNLTEEEVKTAKKISFNTKKMIEQLYMCSNMIKEGRFINSDSFVDQLQKLLRLFQNLDKVSQNKLTVIPVSYRLKTLPQKTVVRKKQYFIEKQPYRQTLFSKRYSSSELQLKIRSKILSTKKIDESPERQTSEMIEKNRQSKLFPTLNLGQSPNYRKKYLFNFYHRSKQLAQKHPNKISYRLQ